MWITFIFKKKPAVKDFVSMFGNKKTSVTKLRYFNCKQTLKLVIFYRGVSSNTPGKKITINQKVQSIYDESLDKGVYEEGGDDLIPPNKTDQRDLTEILESVFSWASTGMKS